MTDGTPDTAAVAALLDADAERLTQHVDRTPEPTPASVLGWALDDPTHEDTVAAWLRGRPEDSTGRAAVADGGALAVERDEADGHERDEQQTTPQIPKGVAVWFSAMDRGFHGEAGAVGLDLPGDRRNTWLARRALRAMKTDEEGEP